MTTGIWKRDGTKLYLDTLFIGVVSNEDSAEAIVTACNAFNKVHALCLSVNGTYRHPDDLEGAVCRAFDGIRKTVGITSATTEIPAEGNLPPGFEIR